jgi:uncharacterized protein (DUF2249 family)/CRP-like cAMP-binding protein
MQQELRLDVRSIPQWQRHPRIFALFDALLAGQTMIITSDHEPRPLHAQFEQRYCKRYVWEQRRLGDGRWEVRIAKSTVPAEDHTPLGVLRRNAVFSRLSEAALQQLSGRIRRASIKRHHSVVEQGVNWPYVGIVENGVVQGVLCAPSGREQAMYDVLADEVFGETPLLDSGLVPLRHVALTPNTQVLLLPIDAVTPFIAREHAVFAALAQICAQRYRTALERFSAHMGTSATARVARVLLPFAAPAAGMCDALPPLPAMTQTEVATSAGTVKEVVSRALSEIENARALEREGGHIVRLDRAKLSAIAES